MSVTIAVVPISRGGVDCSAAALTAVDPADTNWAGTGSEFAVINNANAGTVTVTETIQQTVDGQTPPARTFTIPTGKTYISGSYPTQQYNDTASTPKVHLAFSPSSGVTIGVFKFV